MAFSRDGQRYATGDADGKVVVREVPGGQELFPPIRLDAPVRVVQFSPDGKRLLTATGIHPRPRHSARIWNAGDGTSLTPEVVHKHPILRAAFCPDGARFLTSDSEGVYVWNAETGALLAQNDASAGSIGSMRFSKDGLRFVGGGDVEFAQVWDVDTASPICPRLGHPESVFLTDIGLAEFSADGTRVLLAPRNDNSISTLGTNVSVWDAATGQKACDIGHPDPVWSADFSPDGTRVLTICRDATARVWDSTTGLPVGPVMELADDVADALGAFSPNGLNVVLVSNFAVKGHHPMGGVAQVWAWTAGTQLLSMDNPAPSPIISVRYSPDGRRLITTAHHAIFVWDSATGRLVTRLRHPGAVLGVSFRPDSQAFVSWTSEGNARVWATDTGEAKEWRQGNIRGLGFCVRFWPTSSRLASISRRWNRFSSCQGVAADVSCTGHAKRSTRMNNSPPPSNRRGQKPGRPGVPAQGAAARAEDARGRRQVLAQWRGIDLTAREKAMSLRCRPISDLTARVLQGMGLDRKRSEAEIVRVWNQLLDPTVTAHAQPTGIRKGTLFVTVDSSVWLDEIVRYRHRQILEQLQTSFGKDFVTRISFRAG